MTARAFTIAEPAKLQVESLPAKEKRALIAFFKGDVTSASKATENGLRVGNVAGRRVLFRKDPKGKPVVLSVVDASYASRT